MGAAGSLQEAVGPPDVQAVIEPQMSAAQAAGRLAAFSSSLQAILAAPR
jgi:hypothetical protein